MHSLPGRYRRCGRAGGRRRLPVVARQEGVGVVHVRLPDLRRVQAALDALLVELGDVDHRRVGVGVADPHGRREVRREPDEPGVGVVDLGAGLAGGRDVERIAAAGAVRQHALEHVDGLEGDASVEHLHAGVVVRVDPLAAPVVDVLDVVRLHVQALVGDRLGARRHVERRHRVGARGQGGERLQRIAIGLRLTLVQVRRLGHRVRHVDDAVEPDDLGQAGVGAVDRVPRHRPQRVGRAARRVADLERLARVARVGQHARPLCRR